MKEVYTLPEISFVGGATQKLQFSFKKNNGEDVSLLGSKADFVIDRYSDLSGAHKLSIECDIVAGSAGIADMAIATLSSEATKGLSGMFIYQIIIKDLEGTLHIPGKGRLYISRNIDQDNELLTGGNA